MKLDYGTLISISPLELKNGLSIRSPKLKEIAALTFPAYQSYLGVLLLDIESYYSSMDKNMSDYFLNYSHQEKQTIIQIRKEYEGLSEEERDGIVPIDIFSFDGKLLNSIADSLSFFLECQLLYSHEHKGFVQMNEKESFCSISRDIYTLVVTLILQRNGIFPSQAQLEKPKFKSELARKLFYRTKEAESKREKGKNTNASMDLPNILSAVAARHPSLNMLNIWDITIYQLYDQFKRLQNNTLYDIQSMSVAAWGDGKNNFDPSQWYKNLNNEN
ncbi:hypothetical protein [Lacrimispora sp.]|uniref:hypothetical protein n=1 Tax=Lacrimispora sp. TaxID=2719234 RepID=UPI0028A5CC08|nr:hypothetical protein [Lacrimispora sp.]